MNRTKLFNLPILNGTFEEVASYLYNLPKGNQPYLVFTPNVDHIVKISKDRMLFEQYQQADYFLADGWPLVALSKFKENKLNSRVSGADIFSYFLTYYNVVRKRFFIIGGKPGNESILRDQIIKKAGIDISDINIVCPPNGFSENHEMLTSIIHEIQLFKPDFVFICLGFPKQEKIALKLKDKISTSLIFGLGASIDFYVGNIKRAPRYIQLIGLEWLWRLLSDPKRLWKRYLIEDPYFIILSFLELFKKNDM